MVVTKINTTVYVNPELTKLARAMGLNISKTCENALKQAINRLQGHYSETNSEQQRFGNKNDVVDWAGFEPAASTMPTWRSYQTDLPALRHTKHKQKTFKHYALAQEEIAFIKSVFKFRSVHQIESLNPCVFCFFYFVKVRVV